MGRARGHSQAVATESGFDTLIGARRGSAGAQLTRDSTEEREREHSLGALRAEIAGLGGGGTSLETLVAAYNQDTHVAGNSSKLAWSLFVYLAVSPASAHEVALLAGHGDPAGWPGLTAPAVTALGRYFKLPGFQRTHARDFAALMS